MISIVTVHNITSITVISAFRVCGPLERAPEPPLGVVMCLEGGRRKEGNWWKLMRHKLLLVAGHPSKDVSSLRAPGIGKHEATNLGCHNIIVLKPNDFGAFWGMQT